MQISGRKRSHKCNNFFFSFHALCHPQTRWSSGRQPLSPISKSATALTSYTVWRLSDGSKAGIYIHLVIRSEQSETKHLMSSGCRNESKVHSVSLTKWYMKHNPFTCFCLFESAQTHTHRHTHGLIFLRNISWKVRLDEGQDQRSLAAWFSFWNNFQ